MSEKLIESLNIFLEKHLIPTVISIVSAIATLLFLPSKFWMIQKIGKYLFFFLVAGVVFLIVQLVIALAKGIGQLRYKSYINTEYHKHKNSEALENLDAWLSYVDGLPPEDRQLIVKFIQTGNQPIVERGYRMYNPDSIHSSEYILKTQNADGSKLIKLNDRFYQLMKAIYEDRGSISHF